MGKSTHILVMGVCGVGKSSVASALAEKLGAAFVDADAFHSDGNIAHMKAGRPLSDEMRFRWLDDTGRAIAELPGRGVLACSALKKIYRDRLVNRTGNLIIVHLTGESSLLEQRVAERPGHFMPASLVASQFADLEAPSGESVVEINVAAPLPIVVERALNFIRSFSGNAAH